MKISKLLVLSALWLGTTSSVNAADLTKVWAVAEPQGLEFTDATFDDGTRYYLYNPASKMFFASGNDWNTRASIASFGYEVWFTAAEEEDAPEGSYVFNDNCAHPDRNLGDKTLFTDDGGSTWCDRAEQGNWSWTVTKVGDFYRFQNVALIADKPEYDGKYFGWKGDYADTRLYMITPEEGSVDWKFVTADSYSAFVEGEGYAAYQSSVATYQSAVALKAAIEAAEAVYVDVAAAVAIYNNDESTAAQMDEATKSLKELIDVKNKLKKAIEDAEEQGFTATDAFKAVLTNTAATKAEVEQAIADLAAALIEWGKTNATWDKPVDMSGNIVNPTFDNANLSGWSGDAFGRGGTVADGAEHYSKNYNTYQKITGLAPGIYSVGVNGFYRSGNYGGDAENHWLAKDEASRYAKLYAEVGDLHVETPIANVMSGAQVENPGGNEVSYTDPETEELVTVFVPNTMAQGDIYFHQLGQYANKLYVAVDETGELTIGVKKTQQIGGDWSLFDDFSLAFYGTGADACQGYMAEAMKTFQPYEVEEGVIYTQSYLTAYNDLLGQSFSANSIEEVNSNLATITTAYNDLLKNIDLWKQWQKAVNDAEAFVEKYFYLYNMGVDACGELSDYVGEKEDIMDAAALTNEELEAAIAQIAEWKDIISEAAVSNLKDGDDVTEFIKNPGFDDDADINFNGAEGWTIERIKGNTSTGYNIVRGPLGQGNKDLMESALGEMNYCFEAWHGWQWDVWQELKGLPVGMYQLDVQGYVRCEAPGYTRGDDINPDFPSPVYLYMNSAMSSFPSVYSECPADLGHEFTTVESWTVENINGNDYPNSMGGAAQCFGWGMYKTTAYGLIAKEGDTFRIGVKMDKDEDWWCIFDSFKLTYKAPTADIVKPVLEEAMKTIDTTQPMGKEWFEKAKAAINAANEAIAAADGPAMFKALSDLYDVQGGIVSSVALFAKLAKANEELEQAIWESENDDAKSEATTLNETIANGIENHEFEDADVEGLLAQIAAMKTKLKLPAGTATDDNPIEYTALIVNPSYDENADGWSGTGASYNANGLVEIFGKDFDYYQEINGLPAGTYRVDVQGFYRAGGAAADYTSWIADPLAESHAFIYAKNGADEVSSVPMARLASQANEGESYDGYVYALEPTEETSGLYVCNNMDAANDEFGQGKYMNEGPIVKVGEDGKLIIGLKKTTDLSNNWTIWDNWQLWYFGAESTQTPSGDPSGIYSINNASTMKVEFFTADGRKASAAQKGLLIMRQTQKNGNVIVKKIQK